MSDLTAAIINRKLEAERLFAAKAFLRPGEALALCGWVKPEMFHDSRLREFWQALVEKRDAVQAALAVDYKMLADLAADDDTMGHGVQPYAEKMAEEEWFYQIAAGLSDLAKALGEGSYQNAQHILDKMSGHAPQTVASTPDAADVGLDFIASLSDEREAIMTGIPKLDRAYGGLWRGNLYVICARPGVGKTALELQLARQIAVRRRVLFQSLEMSAQDLWARMACGAVGVDLRDVRARRITDAQREALIEQTNELIELYSGKLFIDDTSMATTETLWQRVAAVRPDVVFTDHLRLFSDDNRNEVQRLGQISWRHKQIAKEFNIPVVAAAQLNRNSESRDDKRPTLSDLRDSGQIEENADVVMGIHRDRVYLEQPKPVSPAEIVGMKFRNGPADILIRLEFNGPKQWFAAPGESQ